MTYIYTIQGENGRVGGSNESLEWIYNERDSIMNSIFPNYILVGLVDEDPNHLVYEFNDQKVYFKVEEEENE
jgi:hypothetical protein